jgi:glycosyltransferase involved in cell wall biosynthesis
VQWVRQHKSQSLLDEHWQVQLDAGITAGAMEQTGVNVLGHFCYPAGVGEAARAVVHGLHSAGVRTLCRDIPANFQTDQPAHGDYLGMELFDCTLLLVAPEPDLSRCFCLSRLHRREGVYRIPIWYWELESVPPELTRHAASFQEIWAPTGFIARAMRSSMSIPVTHMLPGVQLPAFARFPRSHFRLPDDRYLFFFMFDMCSVMERKNPLALIRAFQSAFRHDDPVALAIKVSRGDWDKESFACLREATAAAGATLIDGMLTREKAHALLHCCDCYASLHRSEGFGLTMAEAMLMAKPVIATGYSGNLDFMSASNSLLVDYERVPITRDLPYYKKGSLWAEPSVAHAAECLRWVYDHQDEAGALGLRGQADAKSLLSYAAAGKRMARRLAELETARAAGHHRAGAA